MEREAKAETKKPEDFYGLLVSRRFLDRLTWVRASAERIIAEMSKAEPRRCDADWTLLRISECVVRVDELGPVGWFVRIRPAGPEFGKAVDEALANEGYRFVEVIST